jgi:hypothetical protein
MDWAMVMSPFLDRSMDLSRSADESGQGSRKRLIVVFGSQNSVGAGELERLRDSQQRGQFFVDCRSDDRTPVEIQPALSLPRAVPPSGGLLPTGTKVRSRGGP